MHRRTTVDRIAAGRVTRVDALVDKSPGGEVRRLVSEDTPLAIPDTIAAIALLPWGRQRLVRANWRWTSLFVRLGRSPSSAPSTTEAALLLRLSPSALRAGFLRLQIDRSFVPACEWDARLEDPCLPNSRERPLSYGRFLIEFKLRNGRYLMATRTDLTESEVARLVGYTNGAHLAAAFKARFGTSPMKFRAWYHKHLAEVDRRAARLRAQARNGKSLAVGDPREAEGEV